MYFCKCALSSMYAYSTQYLSCCANIKYDQDLSTVCVIFNFRFSSLYDVFNLKIKNREVSNKIFNTLFDLDDK